MVRKIPIAECFYKETYNLLFEDSPFWPYSQYWETHLSDGVFHAKTLFSADNLSNIPIEVKSGKDYTVHNALNKFLSNDEYNIKKAYVLSNEQMVYTENGITYMPVYYVMSFQNHFGQTP